jgi:hypothetical protein
VLFHELGEGLVLALNLGFELLDLGIFGIRSRLGFEAIAKGEMAVLEELALPMEEDAGREDRVKRPIQVRARKRWHHSMVRDRRCRRPGTRLGQDT